MSWDIKQAVWFSLMLSLKRVGTGLCARGEQGGALTLGSPPFFPNYVQPDSLARPLLQIFPFGFFLVSLCYKLCASAPPSTQSSSKSDKCSGVSLHTNQAGALCQASLSPCQSLWRDENWRVKCITARENVALACDRQAAIIIISGNQSMMHSGSVLCTQKPMHTK